jgi:thiosulfate/3-mercaptopyruvate sulfurtransferase
MTFTTLIDTATVARHTGDEDWALVDCRFDLADTAWGQREYEASHLPGAVYADLGRDLSGEKTGVNGRHPLPDPATLARTLGRLGIASGVQVVAYDQDAGAYASRLWWLLRWMGHASVAVLDGGFARWIAEGRATQPGRRPSASRTFAGTPHPEMVADAGEVGRLLGTSESRLIDARAPERYRGELETIDKVAGRIPGAANYFYKWNLNEEGTFRSPDELRAGWSAELSGAALDRTICYCGSGVTACHNLLALEHAGLKGARLYPGSWSEWSSDPSRPTERDETSKRQ